MYDQIYIPLIGETEWEKEREQKVIRDLYESCWVKRDIVELLDSSKKRILFQPMFREYD